MVTTRIDGAREFDRVLKRLPSAMARRVIAKAVRAGGVVLRREAKARVPIDSGGLRKSIVMRTARTGASFSVRIGPSGDGFYGMFVEFGTRNLAPRPFLRPAFDANRAQILAAIGGRLGEGLEAEAARLAGSFKDSGLARRRRR